MARRFRNFRMARSKRASKQEMMQASAWYTSRGQSKWKSFVMKSLFRVLHRRKVFAGGHDFGGPESLGRKTKAQRVREPRNGAKQSGPRCIFRPVPGLVSWPPGPGAVRPGLISFALRAL